MALSKPFETRSEHVTVYVGLRFYEVSLKDATDQKNIDFEQLKQMVDEFLEGGFTYFDTSFAYHYGTSESALKRVLVDRHPRDSYSIVTKFPTFAVQTEDEVEPIFAQQLTNLGVDYVDRYLLHTSSTPSSTTAWTARAVW